MTRPVESQETPLQVQTAAVGATPPAVGSQLVFEVHDGPPVAPNRDNSADWSAEAEPEVEN